LKDNGGLGLSAGRVVRFNDTTWSNALQKTPLEQSLLSKQQYTPTVG
jgi:hypothetical protein